MFFFFFLHGDLRQCIAVFPVPIFFVELQSLPISSTCSNRSSRRSQSIPARRLANQHVKLSMFAGSSNTGATHTYVYIYIYLIYTVCIHVSNHIVRTLLYSAVSLISLMEFCNILYIYVPSRQLILSCTAHICPGPLRSPCTFRIKNISFMMFHLCYTWLSCWILMGIILHYITLHYIIYHIILYHIISYYIILYTHNYTYMSASAGK